MAKKRKKKMTPAQLIFNIVCWALCAVFGFMLICNITIIIKSSLNPGVPPSVLGMTPMAVLSGSMSGDRDGHIEVGDLIFVNKTEPEKLKEGDVIAYMDGSMVVTHRIIEVKNENGQISWVTKGDANNSPDVDPVESSQLVGVYSGRIPGLGDLVLFMQKPVGMLLAVGVPLMAFLIYDMIERRRREMRRRKKKAAMRRERRRMALEAEQGETAEQAEQMQSEVSDVSDVPQESDIQ